MAGITAEHAVPVDLFPSEKEQTKPAQTLVKQVQNLLLRSKRGNGVYKRDWLSNYNFVFKGKQWSKFRPNYMFSESVNLLWGTIMQEVAIQTDSRPKTDYFAQEPSDELFAEAIRQINDFNWVKHRWNDVVTDAVLDSKWTHVSHAIVEWDASLENGLGEIVFRELDPMYCWWDPSATSMDDSRWFIYAEPKPTSVLKQKYPKQANQIKPDILPVGGHVDSDELVKIDQDQGILQRELRGDSASDLEKFGSEEMTFFLRCWLKDSTLEQVKMEEEGEDGEPVVSFELRKKFPKGRYIEVANGMLLEDRENGIRMPGGHVIPYEHGKFPVVPLVNYRVPRRYAGENEVTHSRGTQKIVNYTWSNILTQMKMAGNPRVKVSPSSGIKNPKNITNAPSSVIVTNDINAVQFEPGLPIPSSHFQILETAMELIDRVYGIGETSRGAVPPNISSGVFFEGVLESEHTRARMKNRNLDSFLQQVGQLMLSYYLQFYTVPRVFRITNKEGFPEFVEFFVSEEEGKKMMNVKITRETEAGGFQPLPQTRAEVRGVPDVKITTGSALPFAKAIKVQNARELFQSNAIDREELLKAIDWPNADAVTKRLEEKETQQAQAQAAGQKGA